MEKYVLVKFDTYDSTFRNSFFNTFEEASDEMQTQFNEIDTFGNMSYGSVSKDYGYAVTDRGEVNWEVIKVEF